MQGIDNKTIYGYSGRARGNHAKLSAIKISAKNLFAKAKAAFSLPVLAPVAA